MNKTIYLLIFIMLPFFGFSQRYQYSIDIMEQLKKISSDSLKPRGTNSQNQSIEVNNFYVAKDGKPIISIMGQFHFYRYPKKHWYGAIRIFRQVG